MDSPYLLDTDVIIDYIRDQPSAVTFFDGLTEQPLISSITVIELYTGVRDGRETDDLIDFVQFATVIPLDEAMAE